MKYTFKIKGLDCANCATQLESAIQKIEGIDRVSINFLMEKMTIEWSKENKQEMIENLKKIIKKEEPDVKIEEI